MKRRSVIYLLSLISLFALPLHAAEKNSTVTRLNGEKIELAHYAKAFIAKGNITVEMAPYKSGTQEGAILLFKGIEGPWDGKAINHKIESGGRDYVAMYKGQRWNTLAVRDGVYTMYVPEVKDEIELAPSDGAAQLTSPQAIFQTYLDQQKGSK